MFLDLFLDSELSSFSAAGFAAYGKSTDNYLSSGKRASGKRASIKRAKKFGPLLKSSSNFLTSFFIYTVYINNS